MSVSPDAMPPMLFNVVNNNGNPVYDVDFGNSTEPENTGVAGHSAHLLHVCVTPLGDASSMSMLTGIGSCGVSGIFRPSITSSIGAEGSSGAGSDLDVHPATLVSPDDKYKEISQTPVPLFKLNATLPMRTGELLGTDRNLAVVTAALLHI